jgi:type 1 glutamine amidotransferase
MSPFTLRAWLALGAALLAAALGVPRAASAADAGKIRVLLITGGHAFEREPYLQIYRDNPEIVVTHLEHTPGTADAWDRADLSACDVVVLYDMPRTITDREKARFSSLFTRGTGLVVTHHALVSYQGWPDYERIIGGRWIDVPEKGGDPHLQPSGYQHGVDIPVVISDPSHPVTAGMANFTIHDEIYWDFHVGADVKPLLTTTHPKSGNPIAWWRLEGASRVVYLQLGHGPSAYGDPNFRRLLANAIRWAARR